MNASRIARHVPPSAATAARTPMAATMDSENGMASITTAPIPEVSKTEARMARPISSRRPAPVSRATTATVPVVTAWNRAKTKKNGICRK